MDQKGHTDNSCCPESLCNVCLWFSEIKLKVLKESKHFGRCFQGSYKRGQEEEKI